jgi:hypothetical protein
MIQNRLRRAGAPTVKPGIPAANRARAVRRARDRSNVTIPLLNAAEADKDSQRRLEREERAQERAGAAPFDGDPRLTLFVVDRIIWFAHWMDQVTLNRIPPKTKRPRSEIDTLLRAEFPEDLIALAWTRLARRGAPVLERIEAAIPSKRPAGRRRGG